jgi:hypothetical protein
MYSFYYLSLFIADLSSVKNVHITLYVKEEHEISKALSFSLWMGRGRQMLLAT